MGRRPVAVVGFLAGALVATLPSFAADFVPPPAPKYILSKLNSLLTCSAAAQPQKSSKTEFDYCGAHVTWEPKGAALIKECFAMKKFRRMAPPPPFKGQPAIPTYQFWFHCPDEPHSELIVTIRQVKTSGWTIQLEQFYPL